MSKIFEKLIAVMLVIILTGVNMAVIGEYTIAYALSDSELNNQKTTTNNKNIEFNSYFEGETHIKTFDMDSQEAKIYLNVKVNNAGYLENGTIEFNNANFKIKENIANENIQSIDRNSNKVVLNKINNGSNIIIEIPIEISKEDSVAMDYFNKETVTKFTGKYVDESGKENNIEKEITNKLSWNGTAEAEVKAEANKFIPYVVDGNYGVMVQTKVTSKVKDNKLPVKETNIEISTPTINNVKPTNVNIVATRTTATNGKENGIDFSNDNYSYNQENAKVTINVSNLTDNISWTKNVADEYLVTYLFEGKEVYEYAQQNGIDSQVTTNANITVYNSEKSTINSNITTPIKYESKEGTLTDFELNVPDTISKGYIYANYDTDKETETEYKLSYVATVNSAKLTKTLEFIQKDDKFVTDNNQEGSTIVGNSKYAYNKRVEVNQSEFNKILGEDGSITIKNKNGDNIGVINKETKVENGIYSLDISESDNNELDIITSAPITEGQLTINIVKAIKGNIDYSKEQMKDFTKLKMELEGKTNTTTFSAWKETLLKEPETKVELQIDKKDLTTVVENKNVEIRAVLDTSSEYNALFENLTLKIALPSEIESIKINSTNILLGNELTIKSSQVKKENGQQVIYVELEGKQTEYIIDAEYKGTIVVLDTDINVKTLTPSGTSKITMEYTNENEYATNTKGVEEQEINFVAPNGIVAASGISNYKEGADEILTISDELQTVEIDTYSPKRIATMKGIVINNYSNDISDVAILGRIPAQGNKKIDTEEELGSTFTTPLKGELEITGIESTNYTVYYSENANATKNLDDENNGWTTTWTENTKSFLVVFNKEYRMQKGGKFEFTYDIELPENLAPNNYTYAMYNVYYTNNSQIGSISENKKSAITCITTGKGPELEAELYSTVDVVREGQVVKMKVNVKNIGSVVAEDVKVQIPLPENATFVTHETGSGFYEDASSSKTISIGDLMPSQNEEISYFVMFDKDIEGALPKNITTKVSIYTEETKEKVYSNDVSIELQEGDMRLLLVSSTKDTRILKPGQEVEFWVEIDNISDKETLENVEVTIQIPEGFKFKSAKVKDTYLSDEETTEGINYDESTRTLKVNIEQIEMWKVLYFYLETEKANTDISIMAKATADNVDEHYSDVLEFRAEELKLQISELTSQPKYIKEGEIVTYKFNITNNGNSVVTGINIIDTLPSELYFEKATYTYGNEKKTVNNLVDGNVSILINQLDIGETIEVQISAKAKLLEDKEDKEISNKILINANNYAGIETNTVTNIIEYNSDLHEGEGGEQEPSDNRYKITGTAWIDENSDGKRNDNEERLANIQVMLLNKDANSIVRDPDSGKEKITTTKDDGTYEFSNLENGEYLVLFIYDSLNYNLTEYKKQGIDESLNSDVIDIDITMDGQKKVAAITDIIVIKDGNARDVNIGLCSANKFDLKIDKYIQKITLATPTIGTRVDEYGKGTKLAKVEVLERNVGKSSAVIEYKIAVTNEGTVPGYVNKIVDYLPEKVNFSTELNPDWYLSENGNIYNSSLANTVIKPGETKEVVLIVNIKITEDLLDTLVNSAEIYESYNEQGLKDIDSTVNNKVETEDDMSKAEVIVSLVTGKTTMYLLIALVIMIILGFGAYEIKKHVLNKKI